MFLEFGGDKYSLCLPSFRFAPVVRFVLLFLKTAKLSRSRFGAIYILKLTDRTLVLQAGYEQAARNKKKGFFLIIPDSINF